MATRRKSPKKPQAPKPAPQPPQDIGPEEISPTGKILFFTTTDCKPCDMLKTWLGKNPSYSAHVELVYIEDEATTERHEHATRIARFFKVRSFPTLLAPYNRAQLCGLGSIHEVKAFIEQHVAAQNEAHIEAAREWAEVPPQTNGDRHVGRLLAILDRAPFTPRAV